MTDLDDRVRTLLEERARGHLTDPELPRTVAVRSRRRRALVGAGGALGAVAAIALGAAALQAMIPEQQTGDDPSDTPSPVAPVTPTTFVGFRDGEVVLVDAATGEPIRVLVERATIGGPSEEAGTVDLEVSPDGSTLYFVPFGTPERIMRVPTAGGAPDVVAEGRKPIVSPDGRSLAYVTCDGELGICGEGVSVLDLESGREQHWTVGDSDRWAGQLAWVGDSRTLAFSMFYPGDSNPTLHVLDTVDDVGVELKDVEEIGPKRSGAGWTVVGYHAPTDGILVRHYCCSTYATDEVEENTVISVAADGSVLGTVLPSAGWLDIESDASGRHVLLLAPGGDVHRLDDGQPKPSALAHGFEDIDW